MRSAVGGASPCPSLGPPKTGLVFRIPEFGTHRPSVGFPKTIPVPEDPRLSPSVLELSPSSSHQYYSRRGAHPAPCSRPRCMPSCAFHAAGEPASVHSVEQAVTSSGRSGRDLEVQRPIQPLGDDVFADTLGPILSPGVDPSSIIEWEVDFFSRPILGSKGKRIWELVVCDSKHALQFARFYPNNAVNSIALKDAIIHIMQTLSLRKPHKIRFFRSQVQPLISKVCDELDIQPVPSRRCITLIRWLNNRYASVYVRYPGFQATIVPLSPSEPGLPRELPDALRGEQWAFVQLPLAGVLEEIAAVEKGSTFGSTFPLNSLGINLPKNAVIPGVAVASQRATPLAAWTNTFELASLTVDRRKGCVVLCTGISDLWLYAFYHKSRKADQEAVAWQATKKACKGLHFLAVQTSLDSDICTGFWILFDGPQPQC